MEKRSDMQVTRRDFLLGSSIVAASTLAGMAGCSKPADTSVQAESATETVDTSDASAGQADAQVGDTTEVAAPAIEYKDEADVLVIGSGYAGLCAAIEASGAGCTVKLLEKAPYLGGNSIICGGGALFGGGTKYQKAAGIEDTPEAFFKDYMATGGNRAVPQLVQTFVDNSCETAEWLEELGIDFAAPQEGFGRKTPASTMTAKESDRYTGFGNTQSGIAYWNVMFDRAEENGVEFLPNHKAIDYIVNDDGVVVGLVVESDGETFNMKAHKGVVVGAGGWKDNHAMRVCWNPRLGDGINSSSWPYFDCTGEMIWRAVDHGATLRDMSFVGEYRVKWAADRYTIWEPRDRDTVGITPGVRLKDFTGVLLLNSKGERFCDENLAGTAGTLGDPWFEIYFDQPSERVAWAIIDAAGLEALGVEPDEIAAANENTEDVPLEPHFLGKGYVASGETIADLAKAMGLDASAVEGSLQRYNEVAATGTDEDFQKEGISPLSEAGPYYALRANVFIHDGMSGLGTNTKAQVLLRSNYDDPKIVDVDKQQVIPHLYAAGECVGGYCGERRDHSRISVYMVFGRIAGKNVAQEAPVV